MIETYASAVESKCRTNGILLDTELLLLLCIGLFDERLIEKYARTMKYDARDFKRLAATASQFSPIYVSPHILAELSNLSNKLHARQKDAYYKAIHTLIESQLEILVPKKDIMDERVFPKLGFADTSILTICLDKDCVVFTADWKLTQVLRYRGCEVVNYTEVLGLDWFSE